MRTTPTWTGSRHAMKMVQRPLGVLCAGGLLLGAGCGGGGGTGTGGAASSTSSSGSTSTGTSTSSSGTGGGSTAIACTSQPAALSLTGTWAALGQLSVQLQGVPGGA